MQSSLPRSTPSAHSVDARGISAFLDALESAPNVEPHSVMLLRGGAVIAEGWWAPYSPERTHLLYSLSKSFTSTAVGFAVDEGLLSLDDTVVSHFPELDAEVTDPRSRAMKVRHLLSMASGHRDETLDRALELDRASIARGFLLLPPDEDPGTVFAYNQPCTYTAGLIVQRATGQLLTEYLQPRLFEPLGIDGVGWVRDGMGHEIGFSGMYANTEAIAKLGQLYLHKGEWNGRQLLPAAWVDEATRPHISTGTDSASDWEQGYGFQFWMARHGYRGDGAFGQFCVVLPEHDLVLAMTGQSTDMQGVLTLAWEHLLPAIGTDDKPLGSDEADAALAGRTASLALPPVPQASGTGRVEAASFAPAAVASVQGVTRVDISGGDDTRIALTVAEDRSELDIVAGCGEWITTDATAASAAWSDDGGRLLVDVIFLEQPHRLHVALDVRDRTFTVGWETEPLSRPSLSSMRNPAAKPVITGGR